jgi:Tol biopolymer transport system component
MSLLRHDPSRAVDRSRRPLAVGFAVLGTAGAIAAGAAGAAGNEAPHVVADPVAAPPRSGSQLALTRAVTGNPPRRDVIVVDAEGERELSAVAGVAGFGSRPSWSPDGSQLAFVRVTGDAPDGEQTDVFVALADGTRPQRVTVSGRAFAPVWSPDGRTIVFAEREPGARFPPTIALWSIALGGDTPRRLTEAEPRRVDVPSSFSPDGTRLAFTRGTFTGLGPGGRVENANAVYLLDVRTLELRKLTDRAADPGFSPDGERLAFVSDRDENGELSYGDAAFYANELYVMAADGGDARRLTRTRDLNERSPSWSADGRLIAYHRGRVTGNAEGTSVLVVRPDGSCVRPVAFDPGLGVWYRDPVWRPGTTAELPCRPARAPRPLLVPPAGNLSLAAARRYRPLTLYWVGRRFQNLVLSSIYQTPSSGPRGRGPVVSINYGGFALQHWPACVRVPQDVDLPNDGVISVRGVKGVFFERGNRLEVVTGRTTIVMFGPRRQLVRVARALRPLNGRLAPGGRLPPPAPGALSSQRRCP